MSDKTSEALDLLLALLRMELAEARETVLPDTEVLEEVFLLAKAHGVAGLAADALERLGVSSPVMEKMKAEQLRDAYQITGLEYDLTCLEEAFSRENIAFVPLKGSALRGLYPAPWMRTSCDVDVLVLKEDLSRATSLLEDRLGYTNCKTTFHDVSLCSPGGNHVELHHMLIEGEPLPRAAMVLDRVWQHTLPTGDGTRYRPDDSMFLFYHVAHMARHVLSGGCGLRPFLDLWILSRSSDFDDKRTRELLKEGGLDTFFDVCRRLTAVWMTGAPRDELTRQLEEYIVFGGRYGVSESVGAANRVLTGGRVKRFLRATFLTRRQLACHYPILEKHPILYPFCQVKRWFRIFSPAYRSKIRRMLEPDISPDSQTVSHVRNLFSALELQQIGGPI